MVAQIVNNILNQLNNTPRGEEIKKLLYLKLEMEFSGSRCVFKEAKPIKKDASFVEVVDD